MSSNNSDMAEKLYRIIRKQDYDGIKEMLIDDVSMLYKTFESHCFAPGCDCIEYPKPINALFSVHYCDSYPEKRKKALEIINQLFDDEIITADDILDETLYHVVSGHCGWEHNGKLLDILIKQLPKERWVNFRHHDDFQPNCDEHIHYESTILGILCQGLLDRDSFLKYFTLFYNMGINPTITLNQVTPCFQLIVNAYHELLEIIQLKYTVDWKEIDEFFGETALMQIMRYNDKTKDGFVVEDGVYKMVDKCVEHGVDLDIKTRKNHTLYDYMLTYGWSDYLKDSIVIPEDYVFNKIVENDFY